MGGFDREILVQALRHDLASFIQYTHQVIAPGAPYCHGWHIEVVADFLAQCRQGEIQRGIITLPPRNLKSTCAAVAFPAWLLGHDPTLRVICLSYSLELAIKFARDCRAVMESPSYREIFPRTRLDSRKNTETEMATTRGGFRLATSMEGSLTGRGGDYLILDDPLKAADAFSDPKREAVNQLFDNTLYSRLDDKARGRILIVTQRLHEEDLVRYLLARGPDWTHLNLPAIAEADERFDLGNDLVFARKAGEPLHPAYESLETLERIKRDIGSVTFAAQYQQNPIPIEGGLVDWAWFRFYSTPPERQAGDMLVHSWDTACKADELNDWSVCTIWLRRGNIHYLLDVVRVRRDFPALKRLVVELAARDRPDAVLIEDSGSGTQLIQDLRAEGTVQVIPVLPTQDKVTRLVTQTPKIESGSVFLPERTSWLDDFQAEVLKFPRGRHDDQVDSLSQYLGWRSTRTAKLSDAEFYGFRETFEHGWWP